MGCFLCLLSGVAAVLVVLKVWIKLTTGWCKSNVCLAGKTAIVTGANIGIGYDAAEDFAKRGAKVILACRDPGRGEAAQKKIIRNTDNPNVVFKQLDLSSFTSVREFAEDIIKTEERVDILVNNAGAVGIPSKKNDDGLDLLMKTNYYGHFLLTNLLLELLKKTPYSRIVNVSSRAANHYGPIDVNNLNESVPEGMLGEQHLYARTKLCNVLFTIELARRLRGTTVTTFSLHPGVVLTNIFKTMPKYLIVLIESVLGWLLKTSQEGAQTTIYCSVEKGIEHLSGSHFEDCHVIKRYKDAQDLGLPGKLWAATEELVKLNKK